MSGFVNKKSSSLSVQKLRGDVIGFHISTDSHEPISIIVDKSDENVLNMKKLHELLEEFLGGNKD